MLRYRADLRTLGFLLAYTALVAYEWMYVPSGLYGWVLFACTCVLSWIGAVIAHNTVHCPVFHQRALNQLFQVWVSLASGLSISDFVPGHNLSHHRYTQQRYDVMRTTRVRSSINALNLVMFVPVIARDVLFGNLRYWYVKGAQIPDQKRQLMFEIVAVWTVNIGALLLDWRKAVWYVLLPHVYANWGILAVNFLQHDGCDPEHPVNHSRSFVAHWLNWLTLNNGLHAAHHMLPGKHWSLLTQVHAELIAPSVHPSLEQRSLFVYLWKTFVYPARRVRYDGAPLRIEQEGPSLDWIATADAVPDYR